MIKNFKLSASNNLPSTAVGLHSTGEFVFQLAYGRSVVQLQCLLAPDIMNREAPEVFLHH
jgi:hypothetical protein